MIIPLCVFPEITQKTKLQAEPLWEMENHALHQSLLQLFWIRTNKLS